MTERAINEASLDGDNTASKKPSGSVRYQIEEYDSIDVSPLTERARRWTRVDSILIENFTAIRKIVVPISDVTILVGPNSSGKSSVLKAIHWAARAASYIEPKRGGEMISFDRLDYLPSSEILKTAHKGELKSETKSPPTKICFSHFDASDNEQQQTVTIKIWAARNKGGISAHIEGSTAATPYKQRRQPITTYIPGLAGLSERETILAQPQLRRQAASGDAGSVLRNILFNIENGTKLDYSAGNNLTLKRLNELLADVHPGVTVNVSFNEREDYNINATYSDVNLGDERRPLETAATGVLQVIQIFAYLILFRPRIMLIDEPDAHLHPDKQERLIEALERASAEFETQIILTTHSPHIVRAASPRAKVIWMNKGAVETDDDEAIRCRLGWGGLDKEALFFVEDEDDKAIRSILRQWPDLLRRLAVCRCFGVDNLPKDKLLKGLLVDGRLRVKAIIHRDGDFMTDIETIKWKKLYQTENVFPWVTFGSDVEAYFCGSEYISTLYGVTTEVAEAWRSDAAQKVNKTREKFFEKRKQLIHLLWKDGGSPDSEELWAAGGCKSPQNTIGKSLHGALKDIIKSHGLDSNLLSNYVIPEKFELAPDLKETIYLAIS